MQVTKRRDTPAELMLRTELARLGLRYRVDKNPVPGVRGRADVLFVSERVAVYIDGCFWHGCPKHGTWPKTNAIWWQDKIMSNRRRDRANDRALTRVGWRVVRAWAHEDMEVVAKRVHRVLRAPGRR